MDALVGDRIHIIGLHWVRIAFAVSLREFRDGYVRQPLSAAISASPGIRARILGRLPWPRGIARGQAAERRTPDRREGRDGLLLGLGGPGRPRRRRAHNLEEEVRKRALGTARPGWRSARTSADGQRSAARTRRVRRPLGGGREAAEGGLMLTIDVVSDVICPWCFIGKRRLEKARPSGYRPLASVPTQPGHVPRGHDRKSYRIRKFGSWERSQELDARVAAAGGARASRSASTRWSAPRIPSTRTGSSGSPEREAFRTPWWRPCSWPTLLTAATCPTWRRREIAAGAGLDRAEVDGLLAGDKGLEIVRRGGARPPPRRVGRAVLRRERPGRPVRRPAA